MKTFKVNASLSDETFLVPEAKNSATSIINFNDRRAFDSFIDETLLDHTIDLRSQRALYGRINPDGDAIYPNINKVTLDPQLLVFGFDFTHMLLGTFLMEWLQQSTLNLANSAIYKIVQVRNQKFQSVDVAFASHYANTFTQFHNYLFESGRVLEVVNFDSYATAFTHFLRDHNILFTREELIKTPLFKSYNTLLIYDMQQSLNGNDEKTYLTYYRDDSIYLMSQTLLRHGLVLDRHSPWRMAFNLNAPQVFNPLGIDSFKTVFKSKLFALIKKLTGKELPSPALELFFKIAYPKQKDDGTYETTHADLKSASEFLKNYPFHEQQTEKTTSLSVFDPITGKLLSQKTGQAGLSVEQLEKRFFTDEDRSRFFAPVSDLYRVFLGKTLGNIFVKPNKSPISGDYEIVPGKIGTAANSYFIPAYMTEVKHTKELLTSHYNDLVDKAFQKRIESCPQTAKPIQVAPHRQKVKPNDNIDLTLLNFLINIREAETDKKIPLTHRQAVLNLFQLAETTPLDPNGAIPLPASQQAYEKLHGIIKQLDYKTITPFINRGKALLWANHVGCNGAHEMPNGSWLPCKDHTTYISLTKK